jgi:hypothetical protein
MKEEKLYGEYAMQQERCGRLYLDCGVRWHKEIYIVCTRKYLLSLPKIRKGFWLLSSFSISNMNQKEKF